jgi:hypothetical protein
MTPETKPALATRDLVDLLLLSALWGGSFLFLRMSAPVFGPVFLIEMRVLTAFIFLFPIFLSLGKLPEALRHWKIICLVSMVNMAERSCLGGTVYWRGLYSVLPLNRPDWLLPRCDRYVSGAVVQHPLGTSVSWGSCHSFCPDRLYIGAVWRQHDNRKTTLKVGQSQELSACQP